MSQTDNIMEELDEFEVYFDLPENIVESRAKGVNYCRYKLTLFDAYLLGQFENLHKRLSVLQILLYIIIVLVVAGVIWL